MGLAKQRYLEHQEMHLRSIPNKKICPRHFEDSTINNYIKKKYSDGYCDYCKKDLKVIDLEVLMEFLMNGISQFYTDAADFMSYNGREGGYLGQIYDPDELIQEQIELVAEPFEVIEDIIASVEDIAWAEPDLYYDNIGDELKYQWTYFKDVVKHHSRYLFSSGEGAQSNAFYILQEVGKLISKLGIIKTIPKGTKLYRCRQHDDITTLTDFKDLTSPPKEYAVYPNRFSPSGISMFYAGLDENTAILETVSREDRKKNNISIGEFETLEDFHIIDFTKLPKIPSIFAVKDKENYYLKQFLHSFVRDITQQIHKNGKEHTEYVPTQVVTEFLKYPFNKNRKHKIEGIVYESSQNRKHNSSVFFWDNELSVKKVKLISTKKEIVK